MSSKETSIKTALYIAGIDVVIIQTNCLINVPFLLGEIKRSKEKNNPKIAPNIIIVKIIISILLYYRGSIKLYFHILAIPSELSVI